MSDAVTTAIEDGVAVVRLDDGKANALSMSVIGGLHEALDTASKDATAVCLAGNAKALCAGFDLSVMRGGVEGMVDLVRSGGELLMRLVEALAHPAVDGVLATADIVDDLALLGEIGRAHV